MTADSSLVNGLYGMCGNSLYYYSNTKVAGSVRIETSQYDHIFEIERTARLVDTMLFRYRVWYSQAIKNEHIGDCKQVMKRQKNKEAIQCGRL